MRRQWLIWQQRQESYKETDDKSFTYASKVGHLCTESDKVIISSEAMPHRTRIINKKNNNMKLTKNEKEQIQESLKQYVSKYPSQNKAAQSLTL